MEVLSYLCCVSLHITLSSRSCMYSLFKFFENCRMLLYIYIYICLCAFAVCRVIEWGQIGTAHAVLCSQLRVISPFLCCIFLKIIKRRTHEAFSTIDNSPSYFYIWTSRQQHCNKNPQVSLIVDSKVETHGWISASGLVNADRVLCPFQRDIRTIIYFVPIYTLTLWLPIFFQFDHYHEQGI